MFTSIDHSEITRPVTQLEIHKMSPIEIFLSKMGSLPNPHNWGTIMEPPQLRYLTEMLAYNTDLFIRDFSLKSDGIFRSSPSPLLGECLKEFGAQKGYNGSPHSLVLTRYGLLFMLWAVVRNHPGQIDSELDLSIKRLVADLEVRQENLGNGSNINSDEKNLIQEFARSKNLLEHLDSHEAYVEQMVAIWKDLEELLARRQNTLDSNLYSVKVDGLCIILQAKENGKINSFELVAEIPSLRK